MIDKDFDIKINALYREMELDLIRSMKRNFALHTAEEQEHGFNYPQWQAIKLKELRRYQRQNGRIIKGATARIPKDISKHMQKELQTGRKSEMKRFKEAFGEKYTQSVNLKDSFFRINDRKVNALIDAVNDSLHTANTAALRMANDVYRDVIFRTGFFLSNGAKTPQQAIDMATKDFLARGINCIEYKDGRRVNIADYASMAVRTANQRAYLIGEGERRQQMGVPFIRISRHGTSCKLCKPFERKVLIDDVYSGGKQEDGDYMLLSKAMELGLFHPRCRHGCATFFPDMEEEFNELGLEYTDSRVNEYGDKAINEAHIENMIQKYRRLTLGSLDPDNVKRYRERLEYLEERKAELAGADNEEKISFLQSVTSQEELTTEAKKMIWNNWDEYRGKYVGHAVKISDVNLDDNFLYDTVDLSKLPVETQKRVYTTIERLEDDFYSPLTKVVTMDKQETMFTSAFASTQHQWGTASCEVRVNPIKIKDTERLYQLSQSGYSVAYEKGKEIEYVVSHEYGHSILNMGEKLPGKSQNFVDVDLTSVRKARKEIEVIQNEYYTVLESAKQEYDLIRKPIEEKMIFGIGEVTEAERAAVSTAKAKVDEITISRYANLNSDEFVAEAFADVVVGSNPSEYSKRIYDIIVKYFGKM